jgi:ribose 5-phosphate isomerase B
MVKEKKDVKKKRIAIAGTGYTLDIRKAMWKFMEENGYEYTDFGDNTPNSQPYVELAQKVAEAVASGEYTDGIMLCWSGIGPCMTANKVPGIRAAIVTDVETVEACRKGNGVNMMCSGTKYMDPEKGVEMLKKWLETDFCLPQWVEEVSKIDKVEAKYAKIKPKIKLPYQKFLESSK